MNRQRPPQWWRRRPRWRRRHQQKCSCCCFSSTPGRCRIGYMRSECWISCLVKFVSLKIISEILLKGYYLALLRLFTKESMPQCDLYLNKTEWKKKNEKKNKSCIKSHIESKQEALAQWTVASNEAMNWCLCKFKWNFFFLGCFDRHCWPHHRRHSVWPGQSLINDDDCDGKVIDFVIVQVIGKIERLWLRRVSWASGDERGCHCPFVKSYATDDLIAKSNTSTAQNS